MGGKLLPATADPLAEIQTRLAGVGESCSTVPEIRGSRDLHAYAHPADLAAIDIAVIRAAFAVAETGSLCLTDRLLGINGLGYLPQHLIVLLDPKHILPNIHYAYRRLEWREHHYAVLQTGPSATADIEGVLIHGAQGVRSLTVVLHESKPLY
jgi:L-lactate dehydrogenase complex protein LldG